MAGVFVHAPWLGRALTVVAGLLWIGQGFLPMVASGAFSSSTTLDLVRISLSGSLGGLLPGWLSGFILGVPVAGVVLIACAPWDVQAVRWIRGIAVTAGGLSAVLQVWGITGGDFARIGPGAVCALAGLVLALVGSVAARVARRSVRAVVQAGIPHVGQPETPSVVPPTPTVWPVPQVENNLSPDEFDLVGEEREARWGSAQEVGER